MKFFKELEMLREVLYRLRKEGKILVALLYGSYARNTPHKRSDIDLAVFIQAKSTKEEIEISEEIIKILFSIRKTTRSNEE